MDDLPDDDFQELSELLFGAKERYRSARATILHSVDAAVAEEANRRFVDWRFAQPGGSGMGTEKVVSLWHESPIAGARSSAPQRASSCAA